jgi:hypothetical protein
LATHRAVTFEDFRALALALPGVEEYKSFGTPAFRVRGKMLARLREDGVLVLKPIDDAEQRFLMETRPETFFLTDHYRGYSAILVRLENADRAQLTELVEQCWHALASKKMITAYNPQAGAAPR